MKKDASYESPFSQSIMGLAANQDWAMMQQNPFYPETVEKIYETPKESGFNQADLAQAMGQQYVMMQQNPFTADKGNKIYESGFSQGVVGAAMNQDWALLSQGSDPFDATKTPESGFTLANVLPAVARPWCGRYCKALGYARSNDKAAFKKCINECVINYEAIKKKKTYKIKPAPDMASDINVDVDNEANLPTLTADEANDTMPPAAPKSNTALYLIIGLVVLILIIAVIVMAMRRKSATVAA